MLKELKSREFKGEIHKDEDLSAIAFFSDWLHVATHRKLSELHIDILVASIFQ